MTRLLNLFGWLVSAGLGYRRIEQTEVAACAPGAVWQVEPLAVDDAASEPHARLKATPRSRPSSLAERRLAHDLSTGASFSL